MLVVVARQAEVPVTLDAGVRQQAQVGEAVLQESILALEHQGAVAADVAPLATLPLHVPLERAAEVEVAPAGGAHVAAHHRLVPFDVVLARGPVGEDALAHVALVELGLEMGVAQVQLEGLCRFEGLAADAATVGGQGFGLG